MVTEITRVGVLRAGKVGAILYGLFGLVFFPFALLMIVITDPSEGVGMVFLIPLYPVMGFLVGLLTAALYNHTVRLGGGLRLELAPVSDVPGDQRAENPPVPLR